MIDKQKLLEWLNSQIENKRLTKDMAIILGVLYGLIETGVFDCNQQWREEVHTYSIGHNENETVTNEEEYLTECDKCEFRNKCLTQKLYWKDKNGREHIATVFECPYEYLCEVAE